MSALKPAINWQQEILAVLKRQNRALSAYDLLEELKGLNAKLAPPTVYRALAALGKQGEVHRIESLNAFVACRCSKHQQTPVLSVCNECGAVQESLSPEILNALYEMAEQSGFTATRQVIELHGHCGACSAGQANQINPS